LKCHCCASERVKKAGRFSNKNRVVQRFQCLRCGKTFSEIQPLSETRIDSEKGVQVVHLLCEGMGINAIVRLTGVSKPAVLNALRSAGLHCAALLDAKCRNLKPSHVELDEAWTFVQRKQHLAEDHPVFGNQYCWQSIDQPTKFIINWQVSKRSKRTALQFLGDLRSRVTSHVFDLTTDGFKPYRDFDGAVFRNFGYAVNYGVEVKHYGSLSDQKNERRYSPLICTSCKRFVYTGCRDTREITVNHAERQNLNIRLFNRRFTRLTLGYSKKLANLEHSVALMVAFHNFCRPHSALYQKATETTPAKQITPAMAIGLTDHVWTVQELLSENLTPQQQTA